MKKLEVHVFPTKTTSGKSYEFSLIGAIIAVVGVAIWYTAAPWHRGWPDIALMVYVFFFCTMAHSDLMPRIVREELMKPYGLKALPVALVWIKLCYEMYVRDYADAQPISQQG